MKYFNDVSDSGKVVLIFLLLVAVPLAIVGGPLVVVWAINTLFSLSIPYTFWTWLAAFIFLGLISRTRRER